MSRNPFSNSSSDDLPRVIPIAQAAKEIGMLSSNIHIKRRVKTDADFEDVKRLVKDMRLVNDGEILERSKPIQTKYFKIEFMQEKGLLLSYELRFRSKANEFCCLVAESSA